MRFVAADEARKVERDSCFFLQLDRSLAANSFSLLQLSLSLSSSESRRAASRITRHFDSVMTKPAAAEAPERAPEEKKAEAGSSSSAAPAAAPAPAPAAASPSKPHSSPLPALAAASPWLPFRVAHSKALGRHALATRDIKAGELLLVERPVAAVPRGEHRARACPACAGGVCGGRGRTCSPACASRAAALGERAAPALVAIAGASSRHGLPHSCFEGLGAEDLSDLWTLVASLVAAAALEASGEGEESRRKEPREREDGEEGSCGHDHGPSPEADPELDNAESRTFAAAAALASSASPPSSAPAPETHWPLHCSVLDDVPFLLDGWDRYKPSWRAQASGMAKEVHAALRGAEAARRAAAAAEGGGAGAEEGRAPSFFLPPAGGAFSKPLDLARLSCLVATNAHGTGAGNPASVDLGFGLFPALAAAFNHSCEPTANFCAAGGMMRARALRDVSAGEQLTVSYVNLFEPRRTRAHQLMEAKHFACRCARCRGPLLEARDRFLDGVTCRERGCKGGTLIPVGRDCGAAAAAAAAGGGGASKSKKKKKKQNTKDEGAAAGSEAAPAPASGEGETKGEEEGQGEGGDDGALGDVEPPWTCDTCGASVSARGSSADGGRGGPADICDAAASMWARASAASRAAPPAGGGGSGSRAAVAAAAAPLYEAIVGLAPKTLHPHHVLVFDSLMPLCNGLRAAGDPAGAARAVDLLIRAMDALVGVPSAELGNLLQLHAELLAERCGGSGGGDSSGKGGAAGALRQRLARSARESAARALEVRRTTLGARNPLTREAEELVESLKALK